MRFARAVRLVQDILSVLEKLARRGVERQRDLLAGPVAGLFDGRQKNLDRGVAARVKDFQGENVRDLGHDRSPQGKKARCEWVDRMRGVCGLGKEKKNSYPRACSPTS